MGKHITTLSFHINVQCVSKHSVNQNGQDVKAQSQIVALFGQNFEEYRLYAFHPANSFTKIQMLFAHKCNMWYGFQKAGGSYANQSPLKVAIFVDCRFDAAKAGQADKLAAFDYANANQTLSLFVEKIDQTSINFFDSEKRAGRNIKEVTFDVIFKEIQDITIPDAEKIEIIYGFAQRHNQHLEAVTEIMNREMNLLTYLKQNKTFKDVEAQIPVQQFVEYIAKENGDENDKINILKNFAEKSNKQIEVLSEVSKTNINFQIYLAKSNITLKTAFEQIVNCSMQQNQKAIVLASFAQEQSQVISCYYGLQTNQQLQNEFVQQLSNESQLAIEKHKSDLADHQLLQQIVSNQVGQQQNQELRNMIQQQNQQLYAGCKNEKVKNEE